MALLFIITTGRRLRLRLLLSLGITLLVVWPLLTIGPIAEIVNERLLTIADLEQDESLQDRLEFLGKVAPLTLQNPVECYAGPRLLRATQPFCSRWFAPSGGDG